MPVPLDPRGRLDLSRLPADDYLAQARRADLAIADRESAACRRRVPDPSPAPPVQVTAASRAVADADRAAWLAATARVERDAAARRVEELIAEHDDDLEPRRAGETRARRLALIRRGEAA